MDEYEVDLRDYLRVIWERKWIIVGVFVIAVAAATVYSYTLPNEYRAEALVAYQNAPITSLSGSEESLSVSLGLPNATALMSVIESSGGVQASPLNGSDLIRLQSSGAASPPALEDRLQAAIEDAQTFLRDRLSERVSQRVSALDDEIQVRREQRSSLLERIAEREAQRHEVLGAQRDRIVQQLDQLRESSPNPTANSVSQQASLLALTAQLQVIQGQMARLGADSAEPQPEAGSAYEQRLVDLESRLQELELVRRQYERLGQRNWSPLSVAQAPQGSNAPVGPNRNLNVAIAGVLGLFIGLLLAFFVHYLRSEPIRVGTSEETS